MIRHLLMNSKIMTEQPMNKEYRFLSGVEVSSDSRTVKGLAICAESASRLISGEFYEFVTRDALEGVIANNDIKFYIDHMPQRGTLARSKYGEGSLKLTLTERGIEFETELPNTVLGDEILEGLRRGDYGEVSFGFICGEDKWSKNADGTYTRSIFSFDLVDEISILSQAQAYPNADCAIRSLEQFKEEEKRDADAEEQKRMEEEKAKADMEAKKKAEEEQMQKEMAEYYKKLREDLE